MRRYILLTVLTFILSLTLISCGGGSGDGDSPGLSGSFNPPQLTEPTDHFGGQAWKSDSCYQCHTQNEVTDIHSYNSKLAESFTQISGTDTGVCLYCHGDNGIENLSGDDYQCNLCHKNSSIVSSAKMFGKDYQHDLNGNDEMSGDDCVKCHGLSDMNGTINLGIDFNQSTSSYSDVSDFCLTCHDFNGAFGVTPPSLQFNNDTDNILDTYLGMGSSETDRKFTADVHGAANGVPMSFGTFRGDYDYNMQLSCLSCHEVHTSDNKFLIAEDGSGAGLVDNNIQASGIIVSGNNFGELCITCHINNESRGLGEFVHDSPYSSNCTECHYHGAGYDNGTRQNMF